jgi:hypothetical protein
MFVEPRVQVNTVIDAAATQAHMRHIQLGQQRHADAQVDAGLFLGQATNRRQRQAFVLHCRSYSPLEALRYLSASWS